MKPVILVIDDESVIRELMDRHLRSLNCQVFTADSGEKGVGIAQGVRPDLVFLDVRMPGMGGVKCLDRLRRIYRDLSIIMLTAVEDVRIAQTCLTNGAKEYIAKPVDLNVITTVLQTRLM